MAKSSSFYDYEELKEIGFKQVGRNVLLSRNASVYGASNIAIGDNVRIDDFCILSGNITIGSYIHIAAGTYLFGGKSGIIMNDFSAISSRSAVYADSDDYSGTAITNPTVSDEFRNVVGGLVTFGKHVIIGSGCTILPNVTLEEGVAVGTMSLVNHSLKEWNMYAGIPCRKIRERKKDLLIFEREILKETQV